MAEVVAAQGVAQTQALFGVGDLSGSIEASKCYGSNVSPGKPIANLFMGDERAAGVSEDDEQIIINIVFREAVCIHSINIVAPPGEEAPKEVKLFCNQPSLGFPDCEDGPCAQALSLTAEDLAADRVNELKMAKFNYVNILTVFVGETHGDSVCSISSIKLNGKTRESTNMANFKKVG
ncbi:proteasome-interacting thioredoxin [Aureococcus anophagefferens]|uniref:Proteasome-interacting thioredoxin n=1 Tax=Aureococcus anophagefferens TaxID=44056 RepID=A0ABR1FTT1_AURAN|nr:protein-disulfide reductase [Aureococcus anophagefferens]KAH8074648.1 protein-disulfide reductase [Aureococcus anophagefferens]KAH8097446.1 protein-disulfide reductase [Aureococcus anophagefferens]